MIELNMTGSHNSDILTQQHNVLSNNNQSVNKVQNDQYDKVEIGTIRDDYSTLQHDLAPNINSLRSVQLAIQTVNTQLKALDNLDTLVEKGSINQDMTTTQANQLLEDSIVNFKNSFETKFKNDILTNVQQESHIYFDGIPGRTPIKYDELPKTIEDTRRFFRKVNDDLNKIQDQISTSTLNQIKENKKFHEDSIKVSENIFKNKDRFPINIDNISKSKVQVLLD